MNTMKDLIQIVIGEKIWWEQPAPRKRSRRPHSRAGCRTIAMWTPVFKTIWDRRTIASGCYHPAYDVGIWLWVCNSFPWQHPLLWVGTIMLTKADEPMIHEKKSTASVFLNLFCLLLEYRLKAQVCEVMQLSDGGYFVCPRCKITLDRDFQSFCDRCGQHLDWSRNKEATIIFPSRKRWIYYVYFVFPRYRLPRIWVVLCFLCR